MPWVLFNRRWVPFSLLALVVSVLCARLGVWQLDRLAQRRAANARVAYAMSLPAALVPTPDDLTAQEYRSVRAQGTYDFANQVALRNQVLGGVYGYHLLAPLLVQDRRYPGKTVAVLVDRGWIPAEGNQRPENWHKYDFAPAAEVTGVVRKGTPASESEATGVARPAADQEAGKFVLVIDPVRISAIVGYPLEPFYIQGTGAHDGEVFPAAAAPNLDLSNGPHLGYAIQWFGLALALPVGLAYYVQRQEARGP